ncbi:MAG: phosphoribosyltransferase family protein [Actinomycetota bacterium]
MRFRDRAEGGRRLAVRLRRLRSENVVVLGIPRGGIPVAYEIARALDAPLDVVIVRKLVAPGHPNLAMGAIAEDGRSSISLRLGETMGLRARELAGITAPANAELARRIDVYRRGRPALPLNGRTAIIVDDGLATGASARAAVEAVRRRGASRIVVAAPVSSRDVVDQLREVCDEVVCIETPPFFFAAEDWYRNGAEPSDEIVTHILDRAASGRREYGRLPVGAGAPDERGR